MGLERRDHAAEEAGCGSGFAYLTRQVAAAATTELGRPRLVDYYSVRGEAPGLWVGSGLVGINGVEHGDPITAEQMKNLFGEGHHPVTGTALGRAYRPDAVARFDLTFSAMKSVSRLWAVAPPEVVETIRQAHDAAVVDALEFLEAHAIFTREGTDGVRQVETRGLIAAAFTHRDSRPGDPDLHTHVAVANKVQTREGKRLSIYGTVLHRYAVAASETYNTLERHLVERLGVRFLDTGRGPGKRPVREIADIDVMLCERWSHRRRDIDARVEDLAAAFAAAHGRPPTAKEILRAEAAGQPRDPCSEARGALGSGAASPTAVRSAVARGGEE